MQMLQASTRATIPNWKQANGIYTFEQLKKLALALDTSMDYLAGLTDEKKPYPRRNG